MRGSQRTERRTGRAGSDNQEPEREQQHRQDGPDRGRPWTLLIVLGIAQAMVVLDATVVNVALPSIAGSLHLLLTGMSATSGYLTGLLPGLLAGGLGTGLVFTAATVIGLSEVTPEQAGVGSGLMAVAHELGGAFGVAVFSAVAVAVSGGIGAGYNRGFEVAAAVAAGLALLALAGVPVVRPSAGTRVAVH